MSRLNIPIDMLTSRLNLSERLDGVRSQSIAQRFSNLKPIGEFLDLKRISKPRDFADVQARVNYNLGYFSSNYAVVFVMFTIYALLTNTWLLFAIVFVSVSMWVVGRLGGRDLEIGTFRATSSQLYTGIACISIPIVIFSGPIGTFLWLTNRECFFRGGGLGGRPRTPYDVPQWGRPPGARLGRNRGGEHGVHQSWEGEDRFQEIGTEDEDGFYRHDPRHAYDADENFHSDELYFDGIDTDEQQFAGHRRLDYDDYSDYSEVEGYYRVRDQNRYRDRDRDRDYLLQRQESRQSMLAEKEEEVATRALDRIARARALGKTNVELSQAEIDALERLERAKAQPKALPTAKALPPSKKTSPQKAIGSSNTPRSGSPRARPIEGRVRQRSSASVTSARDDHLVSYPVPRDPDNVHSGRPSDSRSNQQSSPLRPTVSRTPSYANMVQTHSTPPVYAPYYQNQRIVSMPEGPYQRRGEPPPSRLRADSGRSDYGSRSRSNSHLRSYPLDQLPNPSHTSRAPRFDPTDPRFSTPTRRVISGPPHGVPRSRPMSRRPSDEMFLEVPNEPEVMDYMVSPTSRNHSDSDSSYHEPSVTVDISEKSKTKPAHNVKTKNAVTASGAKLHSKSSTKASTRHR